MTLAVYDKTGAKRDWAWLTGKYGNIQHLTGALPGFELTEIRETTGVTQVYVSVVDQQGAPLNGIMCIMTWPDIQGASYLPDLTTGDPAKNQWSHYGIAQFTQGGATAYGIGADSWIKDLAAGGPYHVWVFHPTFGSDCLSRIGWLGGTDHEGPCRLTFKLNQGEEPPPPPDDGDLPTEVVPLLQDILAEARALNKHLGVT